MDAHIRRRNILAAGLLAAVCASSRAFAQTPPGSDPPRVRGPKVWMDLDQQELDEAYDQSKFAANQAQVLSRWVANSEIARTLLGPPRRLAYGPTPIEGLDLYATARRNAPVQIYLHGGAWRGGSARDSAFHAETFVRAGAHFIAVDFSNVVQTGGDLLAMADQVRRAIAWVHQNAASFGADPKRIYLSGHSSGAHLAGVALVTDWQKAFDLPPNLIKGAVCCSGMYDLKPVRLSARSRYVTFTDAMEEELSAQRHLERLACPIILAYGTFESPEFQRQSRDFAQAVAGAGKQVELLVGQGYNHFEMPETFASPYGLLGRAALKQMKLAS